MPECIYVAEREDGLCKVGFTANLARRLRQLNRDYWKYHSLTRYWERDDAYQLEQLVHRGLKEFRAIGWEVYNIPTNDMVGTISGLIATLDCYKIKLKQPTRKRRKDAKNSNDSLTLEMPDMLSGI